jgi:hypothetical protein
MNFDELVDVVRKYRNDLSRTSEETKEDLEALIEEIEILVEAL